MRKIFDLLPEDVEFLQAKEYDWETIVDANARWALIPSFRVPEGYNLSKVDIAVQLSPQYPDAPLDMVYCHPHLVRLDGKPIGALTPQNIDGKNYQRWSRHRTAENPWRVGIDNLTTHLILVEEWFAREFRKN